MIKEKIAVLVDSGSDIAKDLSEHLFVLPLLIQIGEKTYTDGVDITLQEILNIIDRQKVTTSLPSAEVLLKTLEKIKEKGYTHLIVSTISSELSGTHNFLRLLLEDYPNLKIALIDTKNISTASGYTAKLALELIDQGKSFEEIVPTLKKSLHNHKVFFTVGTLSYLIRGGRIGLVAGTVANLLSINPTITCNENGIYHAVSKTRGYQKAIKKMTNLSSEFINDHQSFDVTILVARVDDEIKTIIEEIKDTFKKAKSITLQNVSPALAIHTGPRALGIALRKR